MTAGEVGPSEEFWHELEIGFDKGHKFGVVKMIPGCCTCEEPCRTLQVYYTCDGNLIPGRMANGEYRMRLCMGRLHIDTLRGLPVVR
jgi:hypothetical protein